MNVYTAEFHGHWLGGYALIFAADETQACEQALAAVDAEGLTGKQRTPPDITFRGRAAEGTPPSAVILWNGNY